MKRLGTENEGIEEFLDGGGATSYDHPHVRGFLPDDHPHPQLYHGVTPIWHDGDSPENLEDRFGEAYTCGFSTGFERGIVMAVNRPEWAVGWYQRLREYYLASNHAPDDLLDWERHAEETTRSIPVQRTSMETTSRQDW